MEELRRNFIKFGLTMSFITAACLIVMYLTGTGFEDQSPLKVIFAIAAPVIVWTIGLWSKRKEQKGKLRYKEGLAEGLRIGLVYAIISPFLFLGYYTLNPKALLYVRDSYRMLGADDQTVIVTDMFFQFAGSLVMGLVLSAVISFFLKSRGKKKYGK